MLKKKSRTNKREKVHKNMETEKNENLNNNNKEGKHVILRQLKFFIILGWIVKYSITHWTNPAVVSRLNPGLLRDNRGQSSKTQTYNYVIKNNSLAKKYFPKYIKLLAKTSWPESKKLIAKLGTKSIVMKPDKGVRSIGVFVTTKESERNALLKARRNINYVAQEYIPYQHELGIFYYRYPNWKTGKIFGIAEKKFNTIIGDGKSSLQLLLKQIKTDKSSHIQLIHKYSTLKYIPKNGEIIKIVSTANHIIGEQYYSRPDLITSKVKKIFNKILNNKEIYYCRFDIRAKDLDTFKKGQDFKILEINIGANAMALHAFDPRYLKKEQWNICIEGYEHAFKIARMLTHRPKERLLPYVWFFIKDEIQLLFLKRRIRKIVNKSASGIKSLS